MSAATKKLERPDQSVAIKSETRTDNDKEVKKKEENDAAKETAPKSTKDDVQRAIEGLKDIPDEELQEFLDDEDFMQGLDVVDAWEGDEGRHREAERRSRIKGREQKPLPREHHRRERRKSHSREKPKREEKKREETRRDPSKSTKDIERDKIRTKRDNESKLLAEKEKAIKHLLDSDNVVPPGTEAEAIQSIKEKQNLERAQMRSRRSRERRRSLERQKVSPLRRRSHDRIRFSPYRRNINADRRGSPFRMSPDKRRASPRGNANRRSPLVLSPERRRSPPRRLSWERRLSADRRWSAERHRRRAELHERRRSRSRDRQRSRSMERLRRRSSRSPLNRRYSPRRRSRTRSRSPDCRTRKRSPFINELARQLRDEAMIPAHSSPGYVPPPPMDDMPSLISSAPVYQQDSEIGQPLSSSYMHQSGPPVPPPPPSGLPSFINFNMPVQPLNFEAVPLHALPQPDYSSGPVMYNQPNAVSTQSTLRPTLLPTPVPTPQPVPAPASGDHGSMAYSLQYGMSSNCQRVEPMNNVSDGCTLTTSSSENYKDHHRVSSSYNGFQAQRQERLKTPEPPVISNTKQFEKTSLSSLLEASVSAKDSTSPPLLYPGYKPEILQHCEHALRELPIEDPRLKMKGRFFFDPKKETADGNKLKESSSNSILLQKGKNKIYWKEEEMQHLSLAKAVVQMHQKICQTDELETDTKSVQASTVMVDFEMQVSPHDLQTSSKEDKKPIMDRLDWNMRETFDYAPKFREANDLRWSLSNSSQRRSGGNRGSPPPRRSVDRERRLGSISSDQGTRQLGSPLRSRETFSIHKGSIRDHYSHERYSPTFRRSINEHDNFVENRSNHSRGESPMVLDDSEEEFEEPHTFHRGSDWHGRGKPSRGKIHMQRGRNLSGRPYRGRGNFYSKF